MVCTAVVVPVECWNWKLKPIPQTDRRLGRCRKPCGCRWYERGRWSRLLLLLLLLRRVTLLWILFVATLNCKRRSAGGVGVCASMQLLLAALLCCAPFCHLHLSRMVENEAVARCLYMNGYAPLYLRYHMREKRTFASCYLVRYFEVWPLVKSRAFGSKLHDGVLLHSRDNTMILPAFSCSLKAMARCCATSAKLLEFSQRTCGYY